MIEFQIDLYFKIQILLTQKYLFWVDNQIRINLLFNLQLQLQYDF